ncbi:MAG TPA: CHASE2 domain-containing protein [Solirubrobacteraceae bacterium]|nr:CHASE2 domain-containing protein [Solirubrobacteraceae bacterium]
MRVPLALALPATMIAVAAIALLAGYGTWHSSFGNGFELQTIDARFGVRGAQPPYPGVVVVGIDVATLESGRFGLFPFKRRWDARMIDALRRDGARTIAYDLVFDTGTAPFDDLALYDAVGRDHGHVVLAADATARGGSGATYVLGGVAHQRAVGATIGTAEIPTDTDGTITHIPEAVKGLHSFAYATAAISGVAQATLSSEFEGGSAWLDPPGPAGTVPVISFTNVLSPRFNAAEVRGKIVVVGATAGDLQDTHKTADGGNAMSGPELEADAISTLMTDAKLRSAPGIVNWLLLIVGAVLLPVLAWRRVRWPWIVGTGLLAAAGLVVGTQIAFDDGVINLFVAVLAGLFVSGIGAVLVPLALERRELADLRRRFARFDPSVVDAVLADPGIALRARALAIGPESVIAGYRIAALIGRGGMGVVYEAVQLTLDRPVALKLINPARADDSEFRARFVRESHVAAGLEHPHVIPVYEAREDGGLLFIAMRLVRGPSLADLIAAEAPLDTQRAARLVAQVAAALGAAHAQGLVHRDVKPGNVLLHEGEHAYLTDFGVTRELGSDGLTAVGELLGSVDYMAPEQSAGARVGPAADVYSLGCVLYEALTAQVPYPAGADGARIAAHLRDPVPRASEHWPAVPAALDVVIERALAKQPTERFISAHAFAAALLSAVDLEPAPEPAESTSRPPSMTGDQATIASG